MIMKDYRVLSIAPTNPYPFAFVFVSHMASPVSHSNGTRYPPTFKMLPTVKSVFKHVARSLRVQLGIRQQITK